MGLQIRNHKQNGCRGVDKNIPDSLTNTDDGLVVLDKSLGIMSFNQAAREIIPPELKHGQKLNFSSFIARPYLSMLEDSVDAALHQGKNLVDATAALKTPSGESIFIRYAIHPLYETTRIIMGLIFSFKQMCAPQVSDTTAHMPHAEPPGPCHAG
ncbi:MAG: PAS domain-containing protein [Desulfotignum sp.]